MSADGTLLHAVGMRSWVVYIWKQNYLLAILMFVCCAESDGATLPSSAIVNGSIDASNSLLEALIATQHMRGAM